MNIPKQKNFILPFIFLALPVLFQAGAYGQSYVKDVEGNIYPVVKIGGHEWMGQNLRVKHNSRYNPIPSWSIDNNDMNSDSYGRLYSWEVAMDSSNTPGSRGICPEGWHIPTDAEWSDLINDLGGTFKAGKPMAENGEEKFSAVFPGNYNPTTGTFSFSGKDCYFWSSDEYNRTSAWMRSISKKGAIVNRSPVKKYYGFSLRCIKDP